jgi:hypothetical protein
LPGFPIDAPRWKPRLERGQHERRQIPRRRPARQEASPGRHLTHRRWPEEYALVPVPQPRGILEADEAELIRDVCGDIDKAQRKLAKLRARIESLQEYAVNELQLLTTADTKLSAAIVAALLSRRTGGGS